MHTIVSNDSANTCATTITVLYSLAPTHPYAPKIESRLGKLQGSISGDYGSMVLSAIREETVPKEPQLKAELFFSALPISTC